LKKCLLIESMGDFFLSFSSLFFMLFGMLSQALVAQMNYRQNNYSI
jgi:hypothetical protein